MQELPLNEANIILGCVFSVLFGDFRARALRSIPQTLTEFFHADSETNAHTLPVSWYFISSSLW